MQEEYSCAQRARLQPLLHMSNLNDNTPALPAGAAFRVLTAQDVAAILGKSVASVRGDLSRAPGRLPPAVRIPGGGQALWLESTVLQWLQSHETGGGGGGEKVAPRRPGRPTKVEQQRRARDAARRAGGAA